MIVATASGAPGAATKSESTFSSEPALGVDGWRVGCVAVSNTSSYGVLGATPSLHEVAPTLRSPALIYDEGDASGRQFAHFDGVHQGAGPARDPPPQQECGQDADGDARGEHDHRDEGVVRGQEHRADVDHGGQRQRGQRHQAGHDEQGGQRRAAHAVQQRRGRPADALRRVSNNRRSRSA